MLLPDDTDDRLRAWIALGVAMAEAEAIWQLRQRAMRWAAEQPTPPLDPQQVGDGIMQVMAELNALRERRRQAADHIERLVRQAARDAEQDGALAAPPPGARTVDGQRRTVAVLRLSGLFSRLIRRLGHFGRFGQLIGLTLYIGLPGFAFSWRALPSVTASRASRPGQRVSTG